MFKSIKKYLLLFVVVAALVCSVALTACGDNKEQTWHTHDYTYVSEGADGHHEECKEDGTRKLTEPHSYGSDNKCTKCGYEHVHDYKYVSDGEAGHHEECKDGDDNKATVAHNFGENDICSDCGYKKPAAGHEHDYKYVSDGEAGHHEECKDGDDKKATVPHNYGEDDVCSDCGYKKPAAGHEHDYKYVSDGAAGHHEECKDGDDKKATVPHNFGSDDVCSDCGYKKPAAGHEHDYKYVSDGELGHHKECKDGDDVTDIVPHSFVGDGICDYCGYVNPSAGGHVHNYKYVSDGEAGHHQECSAGDSKTPTVPHNFDSNNVCSDCGYKKAEVTPGEKFAEHINISETEAFDTNDSSVDDYANVELKVNGESTGFFVHAKSRLRIDASKKTYGDTTYTLRLNLGGSIDNKTGGNSISFTIGAGKKTITVVFSQSAGRYLDLYKKTASGFELVSSSTETIGDTLVAHTFTVENAESTEYYLGSHSSGMYIWEITIAADGGAVNPPVHEHDYKFVSDGELGHHQECKDGDDVKDIVDHNFGSGDICSDCGYKKPEVGHEHDYKFVSDGEAGHHEECKDGDDKKETVPHNFGSGDVCDDCGYKKPELVLAEHINFSELEKFTIEKDAEVLDKELTINGESTGFFAHAKAKLAIDASNKSYGDKSYTQRYSLGGSIDSKTGGNSISFTIGAGKKTITVIFSQAADRYLDLYKMENGTLTLVASSDKTIDANTLVSYTFTVENTENTEYYLGSHSSGMYLWEITIAEDSGTVQPPVHEHDYEYVSDGELGHHQACKDGDDVKETVPHNFGNDDVCDDCNYKKPEVKPVEYTVTINYGEGQSVTLTVTADDTISVEDIVKAINDEAYTADTIEVYTDAQHESAYTYEPVTSDVTLYVVLKTTGGEENATSWTVTVVSGEASYEKGTGLTVDYVNAAGNSTSANKDDFKFDGNNASVTLTLTDLKAGQTVTVTVTGYTGSSNNAAGLKYTVTNAKATSDCPEKVIFDSTTTKDAQGTGTFTFTVNADGTVTIQLLRSEGNTTRLSKIEISVGEGGDVPPVVDPSEGFALSTNDAAANGWTVGTDKDGTNLKGLNDKITNNDYFSTTSTTENYYLTAIGSKAGGKATAEDGTEFTSGFLPTGNNKPLTITAKQDVTLKIYFTMTDSSWSNKSTSLVWTVTGKGASGQSEATSSASVAYIQQITLKAGDVCVLTGEYRLALFAIIVAEDGGDTPVAGYTVTFDYADGATENLVVNNVTGKVEEPTPAPERKGYKFLGWFKGEEDTAWNFENEVTEDMTLTAKWERIEYTIYYRHGDNNGLIASQKTVGGKAVKRADPTRASYKFLGWYTQATGGELFDFETEIYENTTIYAHWEEIVWTVTFVWNYEGAPEPQTVQTKDGKVTQPENPRNDHFWRLNAWKTEDGKTFYLTSVVTQNMTLTAEWVYAYDLKVGEEAEIATSGWNATEKTIWLEVGTYTIIISGEYVSDFRIAESFEAFGGDSGTIIAMGTVTRAKIEVTKADKYTFKITDMKFQSHSVTFVIVEGDQTQGTDPEPEVPDTVIELNKEKEITLQAWLPKEYTFIAEKAGTYTVTLSDLTGNNYSVNVGGSNVIIDGDFSQTTGTFTVDKDGETVKIIFYSDIGLTFKVLITGETEPEVPENVIVEGVEKEITLSAWVAKDYTFKAEAAGEYTITLSGISGGDYTVKVNSGDPIIDGDFGQTSGKFTAEAGKEYTITLYSGSNRTFKILIEGGETEPEVPENVIVEGVEKEITLSAWVAKDYTFKAEAAGEYTVTLSGISGGDYTVKVNSGDPIIDGDFGQTSGKFTAEAGKEYTITLYSGSNRTFKILIEGGETEPEVPENVIVEGVEKDITLNAWVAKDYTFKAESAGEYTITLSGISGGDYTVKVNSGDPIIDGDFGQTSGKFTAEAGKEYTITLYSGSNRTFKILIEGGETEPEVPENVIVEGVEKEITPPQWTPVDYTFKAEKSGEYTITLVGISGGDYSVKVNDGDPIVDGDFGQTSGKFTAEAGKEYKLTFYTGVNRTFKVLITAESAGTTSVDVAVGEPAEDVAIGTEETILNLKGIVYEQEYTLTVSAKEVSRAAIDGLQIWAVLGEDNEVELKYDTAKDAYSAVITVSSEQISIRASKAISATVSIAIYEEEGFSDELKLDVQQQYTVQGRQYKRLYFNAPKAGMYKITFGGVEAGQLTVNDGEPHDGFEGFTFKIRPDAVDTSKSFQIYNNTSDNLTFTVIITKEVDLDGTDGKLHVGGTIDVNITSTEGIGDKIEIELADLKEGEAYAIRVTSEFNLMRDWLEFEYDNTVITMNQKNPFATFYATSANKITVKAAKFMEQDELPVTFALTNALAYGGEPFEVVIDKDQDIVVPLVGIEEGKVYTIRLKAEAIIGRANFVAHYNNEDIPLVDNGTGEFYVATFRAGTESDTNTDILVNYVTFTYDSVELDELTIHVSLVEGDESQVVETPEMNLVVGENQITIPESGRLKLVLQVPEYGNYMISVDKPEGISIMYSGREIEFDVPFEADYLSVMVLTGEANATLKITLKKAVSGLAPNTQISIMPDEIGTDADTAYEIALAIEEGKKYKITLQPNAIPDYSKMYYVVYGGVTQRISNYEYTFTATSDNVVKIYVSATLANNLFFTYELVG